MSIYITLSASHPAFFFFNDTATTEIYTLSLHDALPIFAAGRHVGVLSQGRVAAPCHAQPNLRRHDALHDHRSEEHTSELQSHSDLVCRLLLEKKKNKKWMSDTHTRSHEA